MDFLDQGNQATLIKQTGSIFLFTSRNVFIMWGILTTTWDSFSWQMMGVFQACKPMTRLFGQGRHSMMASKEHLQSVLSFLWLTLLLNVNTTTSPESPIVVMKYFNLTIQLPCITSIINRTSQLTTCIKGECCTAITILWAESIRGVEIHHRLSAQ